MTQLVHPIAVRSKEGREGVLRARGFFESAVMLTKPGIVRLVTITAAIGFALSAIEYSAGGLRVFDLAWPFLWCVVGTGLSAAGANALNQVIERRRDGLMERTRRRPIPSGRISPGLGWVIGVGLCALGVAVLAVGANALAAMVSLVTMLSYLFVYTPLKPRTPLAMWVGAVPGALPPLIGWSSAAGGPWRGLEHPGGWSLFLIMFAWQIPHFLALAWKYRADYARGGYRVLSIDDPEGLATGWQSAVWTLVMIAASIAPVWAVRAHVGWVYAVMAVGLGCGMLWLSLTFLAERSDRSARALFLGSIAYLPLVLAVLVVDAALSLVG